MDHFHLHIHALFYILTIQLWTTFTCTVMHCSIFSLFSYRPLSLAQQCILLYSHYSAMDHFNLHSNSLFYILTIQLLTTFTCTVMHCSLCSLFSCGPLSLAQSCIVLYPHYLAIDHFHLHSHALFLILTIQLWTTFTCTAMHCSIFSLFSY